MRFEYYLVRNSAIKIHKKFAGRERWPTSKNTLKMPVAGVFAHYRYESLSLCQIEGFYAN